MNKFLTIVLMAFAISSQAQDVQLHYDFGRLIYPDQEESRQSMTITLEQFKADKWGSWYYFVDVDLSNKFIEGAYTEISRELSIGKKGFAAHVEYDGGLNRFGSFQHAALLGGAWNGHTADFSKTYSVQLMYKRYFKSYEYTSAYHSLQLTGVWGLKFGKSFTCSGFIDFWRGEDADGHGKLVILTEPQFWYNVTKNIGFGSEVEISNNFIYHTYNDKSFFINPTVAFKYNF